MSKKSFSEIEQAIKTAAEANEPAFDEQSWLKMEAMLDKEKDRKRPFAFWLWWLLPLLVGSGVLFYFVFNNAGSPSENTEIAKVANPEKLRVDNSGTRVTGRNGKQFELEPNARNKESLPETPLPAINYKQGTNNISGQQPPVKERMDYKTGTNSTDKTEEVPTNKKNSSKNIKGKMTASVKPASASVDDEGTKIVENESNSQDIVKTTGPETENTGDVIVVKVDAEKMYEKEIEKLVDSVVEKLVSDKKSKTKIKGLYVLAAGGAEANGVRSFSDTKITGRTGLELGYQLSRRLSIQSGFYISSKKYGAKGSDYKTKPGTYWNTVNIKSIEADCKVYEIPVSIVYNFTPGKKLNIFAAAGLSSYLMKKEDYHFYYERYGTPHEAPVYYKGNKNWFSVLRLTGGVEKKLSSKFSITVSSGIAIPLSGVGEGEVKLTSADIMIGIKYSPFGKK